MQGYKKKSRFSTNIWLYLGNDTRQSYTYNDRSVESRIIFDLLNGAIFNDLERLESDFKVTPFFDAEYVKNGKR